MSALLRRLNFRYLVLALAICFLAAGCAPSVPVGKFDLLADSCQKILTVTKDTYNRIEELFWQKQIWLMTWESRLKSPWKAPSTLTLIKNNQGISVARQCSNYEPRLIQKLRFWKDILARMVMYVEALRVLAKTDFAKDIDNATIMLAGSLKSIIPKVAPAEQDQKAAKSASGFLVTAVNIIGREIVQRMRLEALKKAMKKAETPVGDETAIELLTRLIAETNEAFRTHVCLMLSVILNISNSKTMRPAKRTVKRLAFDTKVSLIIREAEKINSALCSLIAAIKKVPKAHADIRQSLDKKNSELTGLRQLVTEALRIDEFYQKVK